MLGMDDRPHQAWPQIESPFLEGREPQRNSYVTVHKSRLAHCGRDVAVSGRNPRG